MSALRPLADLVLLRRRRQDEARRPSGLILVQQEENISAAEGDVVAVGPGAKNRDGVVVPLSVQAGDHVLFSKFAGTAVDVEGESLLVVHEVDILGIFGAADA